MKQGKTKKLAVLAMLIALAYVAVALLRVPVFAFLKYEPKDVIIVLGGFLYGPAAAAVIAALTSFIEMLTISDTGLIGFAMNFLSSAAFACVAALVYKKKHTLGGAVLGLVSGVVSMTAVMLLWNLILTPLYMGTPRADVAAMLIPVFLPFNLLKSMLNSALALLLYRPTVQGLRRANLFPQSSAAPAGKNKLWVWLAAAAVLIAGIVLLIVL